MPTFWKLYLLAFVLSVSAALITGEVFLTIAPAVVIVLFEWWRHRRPARRRGDP
jgi:hypothetical protein